MFINTKQQDVFFSPFYENDKNQGLYKGSFPEKAFILIERFVV